MYGRQVRGAATTFGTTGTGYENLFLLYDRESQSVWYPSPDGGLESISGPSEGERIPFIEEPPIVPLSKWLEEHPHTKVLLGDRSRLP